MEKVKQIVLTAAILLNGVFNSEALAQKNIQIDLWNWLPDYERQFWDKAAAQFNLSRKETKVTMNYKGIGYDQLPQQFMAVMKNSPADGPDILTIEFNQWVYYAKNKGTEFLSDLTPMTNKPHAPFTSAFQEEYSEGKKKYAVSFQASPLIFAYNQKNLIELGIKEPIVTWEDFAAAAELAARKGKTLAVFEVANFFVWYELFLQRGGQLIDPNGKPVLGSHYEDVVTVLELLKRLYKAGFKDAYIHNFVNGSLSKDINSGKLNGVLSGDWLLPILKQQVPSQAGLWRIQPVPVWEKGHKGVGTGGTGYALVQRKGRSAEEQKVIREFLEFAVLSTQMQAVYYKDNLLQMSNLQILNNRSVILLEDPFFGGQKLASELREEVKDMAVRRMSTKISGISAVYDAEIAHYMQDKMSAAELFSKMVKALQ